jgi:hypothetical protein
MDEEDEEGKRNEYEEEEGKPVTNWRLRAIIETGNFYDSSGTT